MYTMQECCKMTGLNYDTLKYYCNIGIIPNVKRDKFNNYRVFDDNDINWIKGIICLKKCNFSLNEIKLYCDLCLKGKDSIPERKKMLIEHKKQLQEQISSIQESIEYINKKNELYDKFLSGETEYFSYILNEDSQK